MYSREQIVKMVQATRYRLEVRGLIFIKDDGVKHISDILEEIQAYSLDERYRVCKFAEVCADGKWDYALGIGDATNREVLKNTTLYQDFVRVVGRERKINKILKKEDE